MDKLIFEKGIFIKDDEELLSFLEKYFDVKSVSDLELIKNIQTVKDINKYKKQILMARLERMNEANDMVSTIAIITSLFMALLLNYKLFLDDILIKDTKLTIISMLIIYGMVIVAFFKLLLQTKVKKAKSKYYITLFKEI